MVRSSATDSRQRSTLTASSNRSSNEPVSSTHDAPIAVRCLMNHPGHYPTTDATLNASTGMACRRRHVIDIGRSPSCDT